MDTFARQIQVSDLVISMLDWAFSWLAVRSKSAIKLNEVGVGSESELQALDVSKSGAEEVLLLVGKVCV